MTKVKFLRDFRGVETGEVYYKKGETGEIEDKWLERLIQDKRAVIVNKPKPKPKPRKRRAVAKVKPKEVTTDAIS